MANQLIVLSERRCYRYPWYTAKLRFCVRGFVVLHAAAAGDHVLYHDMNWQYRQRMSCSDRA